MGKWTVEHLDNVLHYKMRNLVLGAIKRSMLEKTEPTISYENFVDDLDTGDSFTTSLIDILVKELAERKLRPCPSDRRLIGDRSAKSLRSLATPLSIYHDTSINRSWRSTLSDYLSVPPVEMDTEEDEDLLEGVLENPSTLEGIQTNSELYEAYMNGEFTMFRSTSSSAEDAEALSHPPTRGAPPSSRSHAITTFTRQPSLRRPTRSRAVDFNEFTLRRRSANREGRSNRAETEISEGATQRENGNRDNQPARRFFPVTMVRRPQSPEYTPAATDALPDGPVPRRFDIHGTEEPDANISGGVALSIPVLTRLARLRRRNLLAPETILASRSSADNTLSDRYASVSLPQPPDTNSMSGG